MQLRSTLSAAVVALTVLTIVSASQVRAQASGTAASQAAAPQQTPAAQAPATQPTAPQGPAPQGAPAKRNTSPAIGTLDVAPAGEAANPFPRPDPKNFTADTPTAETVNAFLQISWGYDPQRIWQVQAILKTPAAGVSKVLVLVTQKGMKQDGKAQVATLQFYTLPDGKHIIADDVLPFGPSPFTENRSILQQRANGPAIGAASKDLLLVEFADFQCPHCKEVQATMEKLRQQFPNARFVYENYPLVQIHSEAYKAAAYSACVARIGGNDAFFKYSAAVYDAQASLTPEGSDQALKDAATKVGVDAAKVAACSTSAEAKSAVDASVKLAQDLNINQTPTLAVNGRLLPLATLPFESLVQLISFQASADGVPSSASK